jgi:Mg2+ and Co2+ transporter CorA
MTYAEVIERLEREKVLIGELNAHLEQELECISRGDVQALEETMPHKQKIIKSIAENRNDEIPQADPEPEDVKRVRSLQQDLMKLWRKATGLNNLSRSLVSQRLSEIEDQIEIFFAGLRSGYTRDGKKTSMGLHTIKTGV